MGRNIEIDARRGGGAPHEILFGEVTIEATAMRQDGTKTVFPAPTTIGISNGVAVLENVDVSPAGPEPAWAYRMTFRDHMSGRGWSEMVGVPTGTTAVKYPTLPRFTTAIPPETTKADLQNWVDTTEAAKNTAVQAAATATAPTDAMVAGKINDPASLTGTALSAAIVGTAEPIAKQVANNRYLSPSAVVYESKADLYRTALAQDGSTVYASQTINGTGFPKLDKTLDWGKTWTTLGTLPGFISSLVKLASGTLLAFEATILTQANQNPKVWRSTDDGATWTHTFTTQFPPFTNGTGVTEGTDGSVIISEYGNVNNMQYKIYRSTNDGVNFTQVWASPSVSSGGDVGHIHSVTYDPYEGCHVAFSDLANFAQTGPLWLRSNDNGATWATFGIAIGSDTPNCVRPMFFENYIGWGTDNERNGRIGRIKREDFYAGRMTDIEVVATVNGKSLYYTFPIRQGVWMITVASETIMKVNDPNAPGNWGHEVYIVDEDGGRVSGGFTHMPRTITLGVYSNTKPAFPSHKFDALDHNGLTFVNLVSGLPRAIVTVPVSQDWQMPMNQVGTWGMSKQILPNRYPLSFARADGTAVDTLRVEENGDLVITRDDVAVGARSEIVMTPTGLTRFRHGGVQVAYMDAGQLIFPKVTLAATGLNISAGGGTTPNGVLTAPAGSIFTNWNGGKGTTAWVKESGTGNTGWVPFGHSAGSILPAAPIVGQQHYLTTLGRPVWWNGAAWADAMGVTV
ncbi:sialidase family protein [Paeniglutamicibacter gangotriensis]|uniref:Uncharacterized protein n=1 Tax=Paeniglutamicibacter gangotriensis Lz1y TaxID=1276920 RepID=M7MTS9_9MICC|nr:sialidase family protein [Paeniglutamicibacter gangotriensis]EMQ98335.1 hypothetical protein ADIAG_02353 [Paeniglutamicibacter gangotriensis Lz1y]